MCVGGQMVLTFKQMKELENLKHKHRLEIEDKHEEHMIKAHKRMLKYLEKSEEVNYGIKRNPNK